MFNKFEILFQKIETKSESIVYLVFENKFSDLLFRNI